MLLVHVILFIFFSHLRGCLQSAGWSWGRPRELNVYLKSASATFRARSRYPSDPHSHTQSILILLLVLIIKLWSEYLVIVWLPLLSGVEWIRRWLWRSQLSHGYGRIPASCAVWLHWLQVRHYEETPQNEHTTYTVIQFVCVFLCFFY